MQKFIIILIFLFPIVTLSDDSPDRGSDDGGKLSDMEDASGNSDNFFVYLLIDMIIYSPEILFGSSSTFSYSDYPYENNSGLFEKGNDKLWHIDFSLYYSQADVNLKGLNIDANIHPSRYWSVRAKHNRFSELINFNEDNLNFSQIYIQYNRVRLEKFNLQWGLGLVSMQGESYEQGLGFNIGMDLYFYKPLSLDFEYSIAYLNDAMFTDVTTRLNLYSDRFKVYLGYKYMSLGRVDLNNFLIGIGSSF